MRQIKLYIGMSLNGKIARANGGVDWLEGIPKPDKSDYGYDEFMKSIDTTIQGYSSYKQILDWGIEFPYKTTKNYVITRNKTHKDNDHVMFISENHIQKIKELKHEAGKDIWLIGGGQINTFLFNENLIDEMQVFVMPITLPDGIELFENLPVEKQLTLRETETYSNGVVKIIYQKSTDE